MTPTAGPDQARQDRARQEARRDLPPQAALGLLPYLVTHALDEDYEHVAARRAGAGGDAGSDQHGRSHQAARRRHLGAGVVLALFTLLLVVAATQTSRNQVADAGERRQLVSQVEARKAAVSADRRQVVDLEEQTDRLRAGLLDVQGSSLLGRLQTLGLRSGTLAAKGPGVMVVVDDAPGAAKDAKKRVLDVDLQRLVNGLWQAGAEAVAVNGQRLTALSAIRHAGDAITVNYQSLSRPYVVTAIGDKDTLPARFADTSSGQAWLDLQQQLGLEFDLRSVGSVTVPAAPTPTLRYAQRRPGKG